MDTSIVVIIALVIALGGIVASLPISVALGLGGLVGVALLFGPNTALANLKTLPYALTARYDFAVIPLFILMGYMVTAAGITTELFEAARRWLSKLPSGLEMTTTAAAAFFGAISGSSVASAAIFTRLALPEMLDRGHNPSLAAGSIAAAGTLAATIPPSILIALYGIITGTSIGKTLIAGVVPGFLTAALFMVTTYLIARIRPELFPGVGETFTWRERFVGLKGIWGVLVLFMLVMGGLYLGWFTPSGAAAVGGSGAFVLFLLRGKFSLPGLHETLRETIVVTTTVYIIFIGGYLFGRFMALSGTVTALTEAITGSPLPPLTILLLLCLMYLMLGMFMDSASIMVLTLPLTFPVIVALGYDPIWFGILVVIMIEIGLMTPPVGFNIYVVAGAAQGRVSLGQVFAGATPFVIAGLVVVGLLIALPDIALWLPRTMG